MRVKTSTWTKNVTNLEELAPTRYLNLIVDSVNELIIYLFSILEICYTPNTDTNL